MLLFFPFLILISGIIQLTLTSGKKAKSVLISHSITYLNSQKALNKSQKRIEQVKIPSGCMLKVHREQTVLTAAAVEYNLHFKPDRWSSSFQSFHYKGMNVKTDNKVHHSVLKVPLVDSSISMLNNFFFFFKKTTNF